MLIKRSIEVNGRTIPRRQMIVAGAAALAEFKMLRRARADGIAFKASTPWRDPSLLPGHRRAWVNSPVGTGVQFATSGPGHDALANLVANGLCTTHVGQYNQPWYVGDATANSCNVNIVCTGQDTYSNMGSFSLRCETGAFASSGTGHMSIVDLTRGVVVHGYKVAITGGANATIPKPNGFVSTDPANIPVTSEGCTLTFGLGKVDYLYGDLDAAWQMPGHATGKQSRYGWGHGSLRAWEVQAGRIDHVLRCTISFGAFAAVSNDPLFPPGSAWDTGWPWPSHMVDFYYNTTGNGSVYDQSGAGIPPYVLMAIPPDVDIYSLRLNGNPPPADMIVLAQCLQDYGIMPRDTTGDASGGVHQLALCCSDLYGSQFITDANNWLPVIFGQLAIVSNYSQSQYPYAGGGNRVTLGPPPVAPWDTW